MSIDRSLKVKGALIRHRNVLTRAERVEKLKDQEKWTDGQSVFGLPKIVHRKSHAGKKAAAPKEAAAVAGVPAEAEAPKPTETAKAPEKKAKAPEKKAKSTEKAKPAEKAEKKKS